MKHYYGLIDVSDDGVLGIAFPDCPGCTAMGKDIEELRLNAIEALREWIDDRRGDGLSDPEPTSPLDIQSAADYREMARDGVQPVFMPVPLLLDAGRLVRANISLDAGLLEQIDDAAKLHGLTRSAFLASAAREKIRAAG